MSSVTSATKRQSNEITTSSKKKRVTFSSSTKQTITLLKLANASAKCKKIPISSNRASILKPSNFAFRFPEATILGTDHRLLPTASTSVSQKEATHKTFATIYVQSTLGLPKLKRKVVNHPELKPLSFISITGGVVRHGITVDAVRLQWETSLVGGAQLWLFASQIQQIVQESFGVNAEDVSNLEVENSSQLEVSFGGDVPEIEGVKTFVFNPQTDPVPALFRRSLETIVLQNTKGKNEQ